MVIDECHSKKNFKYVTVTLTYEEARDVANGLYYAAKSNPEFRGIRNKCKFVFDMIKHGMIQPETVREMMNEKVGAEDGGDR